MKLEPIRARAEKAESPPARGRGLKRRRSGTYSGG